MDRQLSAPTGKLGRRENSQPARPLPANGQAASPLWLDRSIGNRIAGRLIQAKLKIGQAGDRYEKEADQVADHIVRMPGSAGGAAPEGAPMGGPHPPPIQRACARCGDELRKQSNTDEDESLQAQSIVQPATTDPDVESVVSGLKGGGESLPLPVRQYFEPRFGRDFGAVRIHTGAAAAESARDLNSLAYSVGKDIAFADGRYSPETGAGQRLLAHELTHVVQQGYSGSAPPGVIQRQTAPELETTPGEQPERQAPPPRGVQGVLIVEDDSQRIGPGQMRKTEFLSRLRSDVCRESEDAMKLTGRTTDGCPYVEKWFGYYADKDSTYIERSLRKYAPEAGGATSASDYIPLVAARVRRSVEVWAQTGEITGVPEELAGAVMEGGILSAVGSVVSGIGRAIGSVVSGIARGIGRAISGIGRLLFKGKEGGAIPAGDAQSASGQLTSGHGLDSGVRQRMETAFGYDFSGVRIHTDSRAAEASAAMNARAFTVGSEIAFGPGEYQPGTMIGDALIAHELAHVAQQSGAYENISQKGEDETSTLEEDADMSAVKAVASMWLGNNTRFYGLGKDAMPRIRSGLKLQRCPKPKPASLPPAMNPFDPKFGVTKEQALREAEAMKQGKERFAKDPDSYDVDFVPDVTVVLKKESYCYNFRHQDVDDVCIPPDALTRGCVMLKAPEFETTVDVEQRKQRLGSDEINSPLAVKVTSFPIAFTAFVESGQINEEEPLAKNRTMNEELHHIVTDFELMQTYKERLARAIRLRLVQARQQAAQNPKMADNLIGQKAIEKIEREEWEKFDKALSFQRGLNTEFVHKGIDTGTLGIVTLPPAFRMPPIKAGVQGSLSGDDKDCR